jgi:hypothetical protein
VITKRAKAELDEIREQAREISERLIEHYREAPRRPRQQRRDHE